MDGWTNGRNFSPFYKTSSPIGAAALLPIHVNYQILEQGKGTADHMMPLGDWFFNEFPKIKDEKWSTEKDLSIETNPRSVALFTWEREANISKLPSQKF